MLIHKQKSKLNRISKGHEAFPNRIWRENFLTRGLRGLRALESTCLPGQPPLLRLKSQPVGLCMSNDKNLSISDFEMPKLFCVKRTPNESQVLNGLSNTSFPSTGCYYEGVPHPRGCGSLALTR